VAHPPDTADHAARPERALWRTALRAGALLVVPVAVVAYVVGGVAGLASGIAGLALVVGNVAGGAYLLGRTGPDDVVAAGAIALGGYLVKIVLLGVAIAVLRPRGVVDGPGLAVGVVVPLIVLLAAQVRVALRRPQLWWVATERNRG
jgi:hypothetical protein